MLRGLYTATSAMLTNNKRLDVVTNNIANVNTIGYKKDLVISETFPEVLVSKVESPPDFSVNDFFRGIEINEDEGTYEATTQGGFFRVRTLNGVSHEKAVKFTVNEDGYLSTFERDRDGEVNPAAGYLVLGNRGPIYVGEGELEVNDRGQVLVDGNMVDNLVMVTPPGVIGTLNSGIRLDKMEVNFEQGQIIQTENKLDVALKGSGFFQVETAEGMRYTKDGAFQLNNEGALVTTEGHPVMGMEGPIVIMDGSDIDITEQGEVMIDGEMIEQLNIIDITNLKDLRKEGDGLYRIAEESQVQTRPFTGQVLQGFLENSNVDSIKEMVEMMTLFRNYESGQRIVKAYDDTLQKAVNDIGRV